MLPNVVVGGGIVGLAVARALQELDPGRSTVLVEKEPGVARHQSGHNSGVIHSGLYYTPGSLKVRLVLQGARDLQAFCAGCSIPFDICGKLVVATPESDLAKLDKLLERGHQNSVPVRRASLDEVAEREPALRGLGALVVESTGRVDYRTVAAALANEVIARGHVAAGSQVPQGRGPRGDPLLVRTIETQAGKGDAARAHGHRPALVDVGGASPGRGKRRPPPRRLSLPSLRRCAARPERPIAGCEGLPAYRSTYRPGAAPPRLAVDLPPQRCLSGPQARLPPPLRAPSFDRQEAPPGSAQALAGRALFSVRFRRTVHALRVVLLGVHSLGGRSCRLDRSVSGRIS